MSKSLVAETVNPMLNPEVVERPSSLPYLQPSHELLQRISGLRNVRARRGRGGGGGAHGIEPPPPRYPNLRHPAKQAL